MQITIDTDAIRATIDATSRTFETEFDAINADDTQCRIWIARLERMIRKLQAGSAAIRMAEDDALQAAMAAGDDLEGLDGMGDVNGDLLTAMSFDSVAKRYAAWIRNLERRERELRGVEVED